MRKFVRTTHPKGHTNGVAIDVANGGEFRQEDDRLSTQSRYWQADGWEDADFPATWRAIGSKRCASGVVWKRPHELSARAVYGGADGGDASRWRAHAGELGSVSLCAACAALAHWPRLLARVAPPAPSAPRLGRFSFSFWVFGEWRDVCVDDRLPTRDGRLLAAHCALPDDYTMPLLEKAYAKLYGSYTALRAGSSARALQDLTGGIVQSFALAAQPRALTLQVLHSAVPRSSLLLALPPGRASLASCVTGLARVRATDGEPGRVLVRLRPAGTGSGSNAPVHGSGEWARGGAQWRALPDRDRELLSARPDEYWMSFEEFAHSFSRLELVHVGPDDWLLEPALQSLRPWRAVLARRRWRTGHNAGGPPRAPTHAANPHFHVRIPPAPSTRKVHVVVSVTQEYACAHASAPLAVGFAVYEAPVDRLRPLDVTHECCAREVATFFTLPAGEYVLVPHTRRAHAEAAFLLRVLTDQHADVWELNEDNAVLRGVSDLLDECGLRAGVGREGTLDADQLRRALRRSRRHCLVTHPSLELCRALVALRDAALSGRMAARELPALRAALAQWRDAFVRCATPAPPWRELVCSSYALRALLRGAGVTASNKVLECLVVRFARRRAFTLEQFLLALARLLLAHERFRFLDLKLKSNPLSLEEVILMTIYS